MTQNSTVFCEPPEYPLHSSGLPAVQLEIARDTASALGDTRWGTAWAVYAEREEQDRVRAHIKVAERVIADISIHHPAPPYHDCIWREAQAVVAAVLWSALRADEALRINEGGIHDPP